MATACPDSFHAHSPSKKFPSDPHTSNAQINAEGDIARIQHALCYYQRMTNLGELHHVPQLSKLPLCNQRPCWQLRARQNLRSMAIQPSALSTPSPPIQAVSSKANTGKKTHLGSPAQPLDISSGDLRHPFPLQPSSRICLSGLFMHPIPYSQGLRIPRGTEASKNDSQRAPSTQVR
ncbi:hypothetical protein BS47DRAFT_1402853 [Hydnum rufescens UP504]|uniref:Uncharacterized protein n=1 Tax=Hydnum rufescens UP504 TaxID=1448309 RepID=A0A9P6DEF4_9AGAM|nr:hypothetical protein BS47DRAFT_1402853 [Hydnum rufescens UP504]